MARRADPTPAHGVPTERPRSRLRRTAALLFVESTASAERLTTELSALGGQLAAAKQPHYVAVFVGSESRHPVEPATRAAFALTDRRLARQALVDVDVVSVLRAPGGAPRYFSTGFNRAADRDSASAPSGPLVTAAAAAAVPALVTAPVRGRADLLRVVGRLDVDQTSAEHEAADARGRQEELDAIAAEAEAALDAGRPTMVTVLADVGLGKSYLAARVRRRVAAATAAPEVLHLRARDSAEIGQDDLSRRLLAAALGIASDAGVADGRRAAEALLGAAVDWPIVALVCGWMTPDHATIRARAAAPGALRQAIARVCGEALLARAAQRPLCLVVDDAQFADQPALDALEYATLSDRAAPLVVCVLARPGFERARPLWGERAARKLTVRLAPLGEAEAAELCRRLLEPASLVPTEAVGKLVARTHGVPLMLVELVRGLKRDGLVRQRAHGESWYLATDEVERMPELPLVDWLAERDLERLPPELAAHARLASLFGAYFRAEDIEGVLRQLELAGAAAPFVLDALAATRRLISSGLFVEHRDGRIGFRVSLTREAVAKTVAAAERRAIHRAAYHWFARRAAAPALLAFHAHHGELPAAAGHYLAAADGARARQNFVEAEQLYSRALVAPGGDARSELTARRGRGQMRYRVSRFEETLEDFAAALALAEGLDDGAARIELLLDRATVLDWMDAFDGSAATVEEAAALAGDSALAQARIDMGRGRTLWRSSRWEAARHHLRAAAARAEPIGDDGYETAVESLMMLGEIETYLGDVDEAARVFEHAVALSRARDDLFHIAVALNNRRGLWVARKRGEQAIEDLTECMRLSREAGAMTLEFFAQYNTAELSYLMGRAEAAAHAARAVEMQTRRLGQTARPVSQLLQARICWYLGQGDEARAIVDAIVAGGVTMLPSESVLCDAIVLGTGGGGGGAAAWDELLARSQAVSVEQEAIEVIEARGLTAARAGERQEARRWLTAALALGERVPNLMDERIRARWRASRVGGAGASAVRPSKRLDAQGLVEKAADGAQRAGAGGAVQDVVALVELDEAQVVAVAARRFGDVAVALAAVLEAAVDPQRAASRRAQPRRRARASAGPPTRRRRGRRRGGDRAARAPAVAVARAEQREPRGVDVGRPRISSMAASRSSSLPALSTLRAPHAWRSRSSRGSWAPRPCSRAR